MFTFTDECNKHIWNAWFIPIIFDSSNSTRRRNCKITISPSKFYLRQNTSLYTAICLWKLYMEIFLELPLSWLLIWNEEFRIHAFHCGCLNKRKLNVTWKSELFYFNTWKQIFLHCSKVAVLLFFKGFSLYFLTLHHDLQWPHRVWMWKLLVVPVCS